MGLDADPPHEDDEVVKVGDLTVYIDEYSAQYLEGAEIDYVDALMGGGFTIHNPNAVRTCDCGHSFRDRRRSRRGPRLRALSPLAGSMGAAGGGGRARYPVSATRE